MGRNFDDSPNRQIPRLLRLAFKYAKSGDEKAARDHWEGAISFGYQEDTETKRLFERSLKIGLIEKNQVADSGPPLRRFRGTGQSRGETG